MEQELKWVSDESAVVKIESTVDPSLFPILDDQRGLLDTVDAKEPGKVRRQLARQAGVLCALAKGVQNRSLKHDEIFIPSSELTHLPGKIRISSLKANLPTPVGVKVRAVTFVRTKVSVDEAEKIFQENPDLDAVYSSRWSAVLEVKDAPEVKAVAA